MIIRAIMAKAFGFLVFLGVFVHVQAYPTDEVLQDLEARIIGGFLTTIEEFPYQISVRRNGNHICGGSIYKSNIVITAAHCVQDEEPEDITVYAGSTLRQLGGEEKNVKNITSHPDFSFANFDFDVAVLLLHDEYIFGDSIQPIDLVDSDTMLRAGTDAMVSGWGFLEEQGSLAETLQFVTVNMISYEECAKIFPKLMTDRMLCASAVRQDACTGDSGGPLVVSGRLTGIVSWGHGCARPEYPGVYSNVAVLKGWIEDTISALLSL